jgi:hypothetical protein
MQDNPGKRVNVRALPEELEEKPGRTMRFLPFKIARAASKIY